MKPQIIKALATALGLYELGLSYWLHSIDKAKAVITFERPVILYPGGLGPTVMPPPSKVEVIPPPWYANLWPEALALGLALLIVPWVREIPHAIKAAYRKWEEWEFGWERELNNKP